MNKIRDEKGEIIIDTNEIQKIIRKYFENLFSNKLINQETMYKFLNMYDPPKLNEEDIHNLNR
jgi:hypothetical protein